MTIKFQPSSSTFLSLDDADNLTLPNGNWTMCALMVLDADGADQGTGNYFFSSGQSVNSINFLVIPSTMELQVFRDGQALPVYRKPAVRTVGATYLCVMQRTGTSLVTKICPALTDMPADGSAVLTGGASALSAEINHAGYSGKLHIGQRQNDRYMSHSMARFFIVHEALTDLEIAKLAHGMQITDLGKTPNLYIRMNDGSDTLDLSPAARTVTRSSGTASMQTGSTAQISYVSTARPPTMGVPVINGTPQAGTSITATAGTIDASPAATLAYQWLVAGANATGTGATTPTYIPTSDDVGKLLSVRVTASNTEGTAVKTSVEKTVTAELVAVTVVSPADNTVFQRIGGSRPVPLTGTYSGEQPAQVQYRLMSYDGTIERKTWANGGATIPAGGTWSATPAIPQGAEKYRLQVRTLRADASVIATSAIATAAFGVGDLIGMIGSSSANSWSFASSVGAFDAARSSVHNGGWSNPSRTYASVMATYIAGKTGVVTAMIAAGVGGTSIIDWAQTNRLSCLSSFFDKITALGGKLAGVFVSVGSNDASWPGGVTSKASHLSNLRLLFSKIYTHTGQPTLPMLIGGYNRRPSGQSTITQEQFDTQSDWTRQAENDAANPALWVGGAPVYHAQVLDFAVHGDGVHLLEYSGMCNRMAYVWGGAMTGVDTRSPRITAFTFSGRDLFVDVNHFNGNDLSPLTGGTGVTVSDASGTPTTVSAGRVDANRYRVTFDRPLVAPVTTKFLSGSAPAWSAPIFDNGVMPMPLLVETEMVATAAEAAPAPDTTAPVMTGEITVSAITTSGATLSCPAATDAVGVAGYEYSINGGTNYTVIANAARSVVVSGRPASTMHQVHMRAYDAAGNRATPLSASFTTLAEQSPAQGAVNASTVAESRRVAFPGGTRVVAFGSVPSARMPNAPYLEAGKWWSEKHPLDERYWVANITVDLDERKTTAVSVVVIAAGVTVLQQPVIQGKLIPVKLGGFNAATGAANFCTFRVTCANGERFDRTIWFKQQVGSWSLNKDADDESYFVADISNDLADSNTTASAALAQPVGVSVLVPAVIQGPLILVKLGGMDTLPAGVNYCDLRIDCANSERFYRTIQFNRVDN